jgi:hypothetical protein
VPGVGAQQGDQTKHKFQIEYSGHEGLTAAAKLLRHAASKDAAKNQQVSISTAVCGMTFHAIWCWADRSEGAPGVSLASSL